MSSSSSGQRGTGDTREPSRRWLADEPLQLLPLYSNPPRPTATKPKRSIPDDHPTLILRAGGVDTAIGEAIGAIGAAAALIVNLTEQPATLVRVRGVAAKQGLAMIGDPVLHRMALPGYAATAGLRRLRYRPRDGGGPWSASELHEQANEIARAVIEEQQLAQAGALLGASVAVTAPTDPHMRALPALLDSSLAARDAWGESLPLIAPLILKLRGFEDGQAQRVLAQAVGDLSPEAWLLLLDGLTMRSPPAQLLATVALVQGIGSKGRPVLIGRAGPLRRLWLALGIGVEVALGRLERFQLEDHSRRGGPGNNPPRWELPELLCSLPQALAAKLMASGLLAACSCPVCSAVESIQERLARAALHNATVIQQDSDEVQGRRPSERLERLEVRLRDAWSLSYELESRGFALSRHITHLRSWPETIAALREAGLVSDAATPQLRLETGGLALG